MASKLKLTELLYPTSTTAAITINSDDSVTIPTQSTTNLAYTGTLTGGTGVVNLGSGQVYKDASGNVGIGTSAPASKLTVGGNPPSAGALAAVGAAAGISLALSDNINCSLYVRHPAAGPVIGTDGGNALRFATNGNATSDEKMRIESSGNVGIGTSSPLAKLQVYPTVGAPASSGSLNTGVIFAEGAGGPSLNMGNFNSGGTYYAWIQSAFVNNAAVVQPLVLQQIGGNVGIGTSSPSGKLHVNGAIIGQSTDNYFGNYSSGAYVDIGNLGTSDVWLDTRSDTLTNVPLQFRTKGTGEFVWTQGTSERMRLDSSGNLLVGTTTHADNAKAIISFTGGSSASRGLVMTSGSTASTAMIAFKNPNGYAQGEILTSGSTTSYNTSSDYRLKENVQPMQGALAKVSALKPVTYNWKVDGSVGQGFIAHELQEVVPDCVTGEKDGMRTEQYEISPAIPAVLGEDGEIIEAAVEAVMGDREVPSYQGVDVSFLVATLTAAIQELKAEVDALKGAA